MRMWCELPVSSRVARDGTGQRAATNQVLSSSFPAPFRPSGVAPDTLRSLARVEQVTCHGVLWVLDRLHEEIAASPQDLHAGLTAIAAHPRCRLPRREINERLDRFR